MITLQTKRLQLRPVTSADLDAVVALGADARVMSFLGGVMSLERCVAWMEVQLAHWRDHAFGRFMVERDGVFVGLAGLSRTDFDAGITPAIEVAWRFAFDHWGNGYATEAARCVIDDGFQRVGLREIVGVTATINARSRRVMDRLGMIHSPADTFDHPQLPVGDPLREHVVYRLLRGGETLSG
jgi:RimJ/RimL family protein N-acetyltransferase